MSWEEAESARKEETPVTTRIGIHTFEGKISALGSNTCTITTFEQYTLRNISIAKVSRIEN